MDFLNRILNGRDINDKFVNYPRNGQPLFYSNRKEKFNMYIATKAKTINNGGSEPYGDMRWCKYVKFHQTDEDHMTDLLQKLRLENGQGRLSLRIPPAPGHMQCES